MSVEHLAVTIYGELLIPQTDYTISEVRLHLSFPRARTGNDQVELTQILYYVGFRDSVIKELTIPEVTTIAGGDSMTMEYQLCHILLLQRLV